MKTIIVTIDDEGKATIEDVTTVEAGAIANAAVDMIKEGAFVGNYVSVGKDHVLYDMLDSEDEKMFPVDSLLGAIDDDSVEPSRADLERMGACGIYDIVLGAN